MSEIEVTPIKLKSKVKDKVTGFTGWAMSRCEYANGCVQYGVVPAELKDGTPQKEIWVDFQDLEVVVEEEQEEVARRDSGLPDTGGPQSSPPSRSHR